jgi:shikimate dehydrogenase
LVLFFKKELLASPYCCPFMTNQALAGVIGWPVAHSRSPTLHNFWLARHGIDGVYVKLQVAPGDLAVAVNGLRAAGFRGANVTIPHKEAAFAVCTSVDEAAQRSGAVNTLVFRADGIHGSSTDGAGFVANLRAHGVAPEAGPALLLGAGGAARAIAATLRVLGVDVTVCNRSGDRASALAAALPGVRVAAWEARRDALRDAALLVNTTPVGMAAAASPIGLDRAPATLVVADIVYVPLTTALLADAATRGLRTVGGLGMLLHQAVPGFAAWFGVTPVVDAEVVTLMRQGIPAR